MGRGRGGRILLASLVLCWVLGLLLLGWWGLGLGMQQWAAQYSHSETNLRGQVRLFSVAVVSVAVGAPAIIAVVAFRLRMVRTAIVFLVLAATLAIPGLSVLTRACAPNSAVPSTPGAVPGCPMFSGGDGCCLGR